MKVAIIGFGSEGLSAYRYFKKQNASITIFDEAEQPKQNVPDDVEFVHGREAFSKLKGFDKVVRFPGIHPKRLLTDGEITSNTKEFFTACPTKNIIGVTATKGKGTIATLIYGILKESGKSVHLAGNIGVPALDILDAINADDIVVLELSSFQLWDLEQSPHIAVVGMIEPEHLEVHDNFADYVTAKANIAKWQTKDDKVIYHPTNEYSAQIARQSKGIKIRYNTPEGAFVEDNKIFVSQQIQDTSGAVVGVHSFGPSPGGDDIEICLIKNVRIPGSHNLDNICAAITAAWAYTQDINAIRQAVTQFGGLEHRLEFVREVHGIKFYNDSIATTPGSVIAALSSFAPEHTILIIGGSYDKGADFIQLAKLLSEKQPKKAIFIGKIGQKIANMAKDQGFANGEVLEEWTLASATRQAFEAADIGDVVILSPAAASFGDFANYQERGTQFKEIVNGL